MKNNPTITIDDVAYELSTDFLSRVLETAVEGGCSYWADVTVEDSEESAGQTGSRDFEMSEDDEDTDHDDGATVYRAASFLVSKDPAKGGTLDLQGVADAIERLASGEVEVPPAIREIIVEAVQNEDADDIDAEAADCIVQIGLFDEIVYQ
jgi:hypothetical protein